MNEKHLKRISKNLSYVLRHRPDTIGLELSDGGWVGVDDLLAALELPSAATGLCDRRSRENNAVPVRARNGSGGRVV